MTPTGALTPSQHIIAEVRATLRGFLADRRRELEEISPAAVTLVDRVSPMLDGGKRIRATLLWWGHDLAAGTDAQSAVAGLPRAAAALEFLQAAALVHDDIIDHSLTRRGLPAVHAAFAAAHREEGYSGEPGDFGTAAGIILGDLCLAWHEQIFEASELPLRQSPGVIRQRDRMRSEVMVGQYLDVLIQAQHLGPEEIRRDAWQVLTYKSAKYSVEQPLLLGAALGGASEALLSALSAYGLPLGQAFQLRDDVLGVFGDAELTGKPAGDDLREGKRTVLLGFALEGAPEGALDRIGAPDLAPEEIDRLRGVIVDSGALRRTEAEIGRLAADARRAALALAEHGVGDAAIEELIGFTERIAVRSS